MYSRDVTLYRYVITSKWSILEEVTTLEQLRYYGFTELGEALGGWDRRKVQLYYKRGKIMEPAAKVGNRPLWSAEQVKKIRRELNG